MDHRNQYRVEEVAARLIEAERILVITGAGISAESDIPTFRSEGGWWRSHNPEELATWAAFQRDPKKVWEWYDHRRALVAVANPNPAHQALAEWERRKKRVLIITQNVDDLHERAGSTELIHIHGSIWEVKCLREGVVSVDRRVPLPVIPPLCSCGGLLRPNIVWFDEELPPAECERIEELFREGAVDLAFAIGTEATFDYIRDWALRSKRQGALLIEINIATTPLTPSVDAHLAGPAGQMLDQLNKAAFGDQPERS